MSLLKQFDITGKNIVITGAARGIGKGIIRVLAESGANILCTALTDVYLNKLVEELSMKDIKIEVLATDNTTIPGWDRTIDFALQKLGNILLVGPFNNSPYSKLPIINICSFTAISAFTFCS